MAEVADCKWEFLVRNWKRGQKTIKVEPVFGILFYELGDKVTGIHLALG